MAPVVGALLVVGCGKTAPPPPAPIEVLVAEVVRQDVPVTGDWVGTTDGYINAQIRAKVQGYLLKQGYRDGSSVKAGQLLYQLDPRQYQADLDKAVGDLAQAKANLLRSQQNEAKYLPLVKVGAVSQREYDNTVQEVLGNQAAVEAAQGNVAAAKLNLDWTRITSPIDGVAGITQAQIGDLISPTTVMTTVSQVDPIKVYFPISEQEYLKFADGIEHFRRTGDASTAPTLQLILANGDLYAHTGKPSAVNRQVESQHRLHPDRVAVRQPGQSPAPRPVRPHPGGDREPEERSRRPAASDPGDPGEPSGGGRGARRHGRHPRRQGGSAVRGTLGDHGRGQTR